jgi:hypothetical protein
MITMETSTREAAAALEAVIERHTPRDGALCAECHFVAPCFTTRAVMHAIKCLANIE